MANLTSLNTPYPSRIVQDIVRLIPIAITTAGQNGRACAFSWISDMTSPIERRGIGTKRTGCCEVSHAASVIVQILVVAFVRLSECRQNDGGRHNSSDQDEFHWRHPLYALLPPTDTLHRASVFFPITLSRSVGAAIPTHDGIRDFISSPHWH